MAPSEFRINLNSDIWYAHYITFRKSGYIVTVTLDRNIKLGTTGTQTVLGIIPNEYHPNNEEKVTIVNANDNGSTGYHFYISADGNVLFRGFGTIDITINASISILTYICN